jgi:hypothetical protein
MIKKLEELNNNLLIAQILADLEKLEEQAKLVEPSSPQGVKLSISALKLINKLLDSEK